MAWLSSSADSGSPRTTEALKTDFKTLKTLLKWQRIRNADMTDPKCQKFHVTSDHLVFLENELDKAAAHQATLGSGELITY